VASFNLAHPVHSAYKIQLIKNFKSAYLIFSLPTA